MATRIDSVIMTLDARGEEEIVQKRKEPLVLTVSLTNAQAVTEVNRLAVAAHRLRGELDGGTLSAGEYQSRLKAIERGRPKRFTLGKRDLPWTRLVRFHRVVRGRPAPLRWRVHPLANPPPETMVVLDGYSSAAADFGIDAAFLSGLKLGTYVLRASLRAGRGELLESNDLRIRLAGRAPSTDPQALLKTATYEFRRRRYARAAALVRLVLREFPAFIGALILSGDIDAARGRFRKALISYNSALEEFQRQAPEAIEQPQSLLAKIAEVEKRLGGRAR